MAGVTRTTPSWRGRITRFLRGFFSTRSSPRRSPILAFFPSAAAAKRRVSAENNPEAAKPCPRCGAAPATGSSGSSGLQGAAAQARWPIAIGVALVTVTAFWLGREFGRVRAVRGIAPQARAALSPNPRMTPGVRASVAHEAVDPVATASGATWAIYTSRDRLTDHPLFGARFETPAGIPLFSVLCAEGQGAVSLTRGLLPATEGASGNARALGDTVRMAFSMARGALQPVELRFGESAPESLSAIPGRPLDFLHRVAASQKIRTASDDFDPTPWSDPIARVISECRFSAPEELPPRGEPRTQ